MNDIFTSCPNVDPKNSSYVLMEIDVSASSEYIFSCSLYFFEQTIVQSWLEKILKDG